MQNKTVLCESIIRYNALQKRKVFLDSIAQGLDEFGILSVIQIFPDLFSGLFISSTKIVANDVLEIIRYPAKMTEEEGMAMCFFQGMCAAT